MAVADEGPVNSRALIELLSLLVPLVGTPGIAYEELSRASARLRLSEAPRLHDHLDGLPPVSLPMNVHRTRTSA